MARRPSDLTTRTIVPALVLALASGCFAANARVELTREVTRLERVLPERLGAGALTNVRADAVTLAKRDGTSVRIGRGQVSVVQDEVLVAAGSGPKVTHIVRSASVASVDLSHRVMDERTTDMLPIAAEAKSATPAVGVVLAVIFGVAEALGLTFVISCFSINTCFH